MEEQGTVIEIQGELAVVQARRGQACQGCHAEAGGHCGCEMLGPEKKLMHLRALNRAGARKGDTVEVSVGAPNVLKVSALLYITPLIGLICGALLGRTLASAIALGLPEELVVGFSGMLGMALVFVFLRLVLRRLETNAEYVPVVTRVIHSVP
ncbi:MAG: SoxR reducing system RseC family protein [Candidatus Alcyoniella australis]|nr:SoxR reducing system RseC family protein [Candidatus Alcyoniella australis]